MGMLATLSATMPPASASLLKKKGGRGQLERPPIRGHTLTLGK
jgi:hypothetical protein